ncbi:MAG: hypothetical protein QGF00_11860 [Planctomycetota bacterium]|nr:hypothetical protein [Planctomycetota bacterium]MDP7250288.1 hypothetical protein [Planctomycetota bacterium]
MTGSTFGHSKFQRRNCSAVCAGNWFFEAGTWHDDQRSRLVIRVSHSDAESQTATLPDGRRVTLARRSHS